MRIFTELEKEKIKMITSHSVEMAYLSPTKTGLGKSILDAIAPLRIYLKGKNYHDYDEQKQGPENKVQGKAYYILQDELKETNVTLYRPNTKRGDPRIWFSNLPKHANAEDILGIVEYKGDLYVINITKYPIDSIMDEDTKTPLLHLLEYFENESYGHANELLEKIRIVAQKGPILSLVNADTGVGRTLEDELGKLGINISSDSVTDYKGIEIKSFRERKGKRSKTRKTLFAQVPNWKLSLFKSSREILERFGYYRDNAFKLYCQVDTIKPNSQGLMFEIPPDGERLFEIYKEHTNIIRFAAWEMKNLRDRLVEKHTETFWVEAESKDIDGHEYYIYKKIEHTKNPILSQFDILLRQGIISMDHLIKRNQKGRVSEKGPLFKIEPDAIDLLFPPPKVYNL